MSTTLNTLHLAPCPPLPDSNEQDVSANKVAFNSVTQSTVEFLEGKPSEVILAAIEVVASRNVSLLLQLRASSLFKVDTKQRQEEVLLPGIACAAVEETPKADGDVADTAEKGAASNARDEEKVDAQGKNDEEEDDAVEEASDVQEDTGGTGGKVIPRKSVAPGAAGGILQFSTNIYYAKEGEDNEMIIDVVRLGGSDQEVCTCHFATQDASGVAGKRYVARSGVLEFGIGEVMKQIAVPIINDDSWEVTLEFKIVLSQPTNAMLGRYLHTCRIKVIDKDCFPTNRFKDDIRSNRYEQIPMVTLLFEYFKMNYHYSPIVQKGTLHILFFDQVENLYFIWRLLVLKAVVDKVIGPKCDREDEKVLLLLPCPDNLEDKDAYQSQQQVLLISLALGIIIPHAIVHFLEYRKVFTRVGGTSMKTLQANLVTKFLNYAESSRTHLGPATLIMAMTRDTQEVVHDGYMQIFPLLMYLGRLAMMLALQFSMGANFAAIPVIAIPMVLGFWLGIRNQKSTNATNNQVKAQNDLIRYVSFVAQRYRLIIDYFKRPDAVRECETKIVIYNRMQIISDAVSVNTKIMASWLSVTSIGLWLLVGGMRVITEEETLGVFLTNLEVFREVGESWSKIYEVTLHLQQSLPYLQRIVQLMNLPIDLEKRMRLNRRRRKLGEDARKAMRAHVRDTGEYAADLVPIKLDDITFQHESVIQNLLEKSDDSTLEIEGRRGSTASMSIFESFGSLRKSHRKSQTVSPEQDEGQSARKEVQLVEELQAARKKEGALEGCTLEFNQGTLISIVGLPGGGKSTLLKLIGGVLIPDSGDLLIPPHLRCLHISQEPIFFNGTLYENLTYGLTMDDTADRAPDRVLEICKKLKVSDQICKFIMPSNQELFEHRSDWDEVLSTTQCVLLNLARAFVANPELLVIHKPTLVFDDVMADNTFCILREYVTQKGLVMDPTMWPHRRPRTCVITTASSKGVMAADQTFTVTPQGILKAPRRSITKAMFL